MKDGASKSFEQCYNAQAAVDSTAQVIVAAALTQQTNDKQQLVPMMQKTIENMGRAPEAASADAGYFSAAAISDPILAGINLLVPPDRQKHSGPAEQDDPRSQVDPAVRAMRDRLREPTNLKLYSRRKVVVEPVFGQTKDAFPAARLQQRCCRMEHHLPDAQPAQALAHAANGALRRRCLLAPPGPSRPSPSAVRFTPPTEIGRGAKLTACTVRNCRERNRERERERELQFARHAPRAHSLRACSRPTEQCSCAPPSDSW